MWYPWRHASPPSVRPLTDAERQALEAGLRSSEAFTLRRCQILLASARGEHVPAIARTLGCDEQTVRNAIHAFARDGLAALAPGSSRPQTIQAAFDAAGAEALAGAAAPQPARLRPPDQPLDLGAGRRGRRSTEGLTAARVSGETVRATLARSGVRWQRAKRWITSPDPAYARKKASATA